MASSMWANEKFILRNAELKCMQFAQNLDVIQKIWAQIRIQRPQITQYQFSKFMQERKKKFVDQCYQIQAVFVLLDDNFFFFSSFTRFEKSKPNYLFVHCSLILLSK